MRYHFHICDHDGVIHDEEGSELPSLEAAQDEARASARDLVIEDLKCGAAVPERIIEIATPEGMVIHRLTVLDVVH
jgi:hypothetical protein